MITAWSIRMRVFYQPLADLSIGCFEVGTSNVRASDTIPYIIKLKNGGHGLMIKIMILE